MPTASQHLMPPAPATVVGAPRQRRSSRARAAISAPLVVLAPITVMLLSGCASTTCHVDHRRHGYRLETSLRPEPAIALAFGLDDERGDPMRLPHALADAGDE